MEDGAQGGLPNSDEVLICTSETTSEEVSKNRPRTCIQALETPIRDGVLSDNMISSTSPRVVAVISNSKKTLNLKFSPEGKLQHFFFR